MEGSGDRLGRSVGIVGCGPAAVPYPDPRCGQSPWHRHPDHPPSSSDPANSVRRCRQSTWCRMPAERDSAAVTLGKTRAMAAWTGFGDVHHPWLGRARLAGPVGSAHSVLAPIGNSRMEA